MDGPTASHGPTISDLPIDSETIHEVAEALVENFRKQKDVRKDGRVGAIKGDTHELRELNLAQKLLKDIAETEFGFCNKKKIHYRNLLLLQS